LDKLIIHHGDRVTEHEIGDVPITIGRDPECDLFFADKKLSRKHARVERHGESFRLIDLESRNGTWVNDERVEARDLAPGDEIRLGGLRITLEWDPARIQTPPDDSTVYLSEPGFTDEKGLGDAGTVLLAVPDAETQATTQTVRRDDSSSTVFLKPDEPAAFTELDEGDETLKKPEPEKTVVLAGQVPRKLYDTGTVVFRGQAEPILPEPPTRLAPRESSSAPIHDVELMEEEGRDLSEPSLTASVTYVPELDAGAGRGWAAKFAPLAVALAAFALLVVVLPLFRILSSALVEESSGRGLALLDLLAAGNEAALADGRLQDVSVERVAAEPGVLQAEILSSEGEVLSPKDRAGQPSAIEGIADVVHIRSFQEGRDSKGNRVLARPVMHRGTRVGIAVLTHRSAGPGLPWVALVFGSLLLAIAVAAVVLIARRMTVSPLHDLRLEVDALIEGRSAPLPLARPYSELSQLASSLNRVLAARRAISGSEAMGARKSSAQNRH
jgi:pSer/pThr/pTyr-binding forkhead associated (FHA) protein